MRRGWFVRKQKSPGPKARLFKPRGAGALAREAMSKRYTAATGSIITYLPN
jgi:hypothetical protein